MPDPTEPRAVADDPSGIVQQMPKVSDEELSELRPCPFCGASARVFRDALPLYPIWWVECSRRPIPHHTTAFRSEREALDGWNHRAIEADLRAEVERLRCMIDRAAEILSNCSVESGVCCCGDAMDNHTAPMHSGHSPVDQGSYITDEWLKSYRALSPETDGGQDG